MECLRPCYRILYYFCNINTGLLGYRLIKKNVLQQPDIHIIDRPLLNRLFRPRRSNSYKGDHGHALLIAGNDRKMGAALIAATACIRAGVGLLTLKIPIAQTPCVFSRLPEAMVQVREDDLSIESFQAVGMGPGLGTDHEAVNLLRSVLNAQRVPLVVDADAISILAQHPVLIDRCGKSTIFTPHTGEFDRLFGGHPDQEQRLATAYAFSKAKGIIIVLKAAETIIVTPEICYKNICGNAGLAKGGSGDALTGVMTAFLAQGYDTVSAAILAVHLHARAADFALQTQSVESMLITDVIDCFGSVFKELLHDR